MTRLRDLPDVLYDLVIVGGGIVGAGAARDAALRGLKVVLLERHDYGGGTTAASTRIAHGGLRYLEMLDFRLVRLDLREREILLRIAPHLVSPLEFVIPFYGRSRFYRARLRAGLLLYDALSFDKSLPNHRFMGSEEIRAYEPSLRREELQGGGAYYDALVESPERLCLENIVDAREHGAHTFNYAEVIGGMRQDAAVAGVRVRDLLDGTETDIRSRLVLNAAGPWADEVHQILTGTNSRRLARTKGIHLACPPVTQRALVLFSKLDGRLFFAIPSRGYSWIGTTDTHFEGEPSTAQADEADVNYLVKSVGEYLPDLDTSRIFFTTAGVRALVRQERNPSAISRLHRVADEVRTGVQGLITVLGGKITGYRGIAQEAIDLACRKLGRQERCETAGRPLPGARAPRSESPPPGIDRPTLDHLRRLYGSRALEICRIAAGEPELGQSLGAAHPDIGAQVVFGVRHEQCATVADFMLRRTLLGLSPDQGLSALVPVTTLMARELGWSAERQTREVTSYRHRADGVRSWSDPGDGEDQ
jgi:glycerol-3-phosphate dehydrogenase